MGKKTVLFATCIGFIGGHLVTKYGKQFVNYIKNSNNKKPLDEIVLDIKNAVHKNVDDSFKCVENFYTDHICQVCKKELEDEIIDLSSEKDLRKNYISVSQKDKRVKNVVTMDDLINKAMEFNSVLDKSLSNKKDKISILDVKPDAYLEKEEVIKDVNVSKKDESTKDIKHDIEMNKLCKCQSLKKNFKSNKNMEENFEEKIEK